jgi:hypothetical protein
VSHSREATEAYSDTYRIIGDCDDACEIRKLRTAFDAGRASMHVDRGALMAFLQSTDHEWIADDIDYMTDAMFESGLITERTEQ